MPGDTQKKATQAFLEKYLPSHAARLFFDRFQMLNYDLTGKLAVLAKELPACKANLGRRFSHLEFEALLLRLLGETYRNDIEKHPGIKQAVRYTIRQYKSLPRLHRQRVLRKANKQQRRDARDNGTSGNISSPSAEVSTQRRVRFVEEPERQDKSASETVLDATTASQGY